MQKNTNEFIRTVAETRSISQVAEKLSVSQPAVSAKIKKIEEKYHIRIFDRSTQPLELTPEGKALLAYFDREEELEKSFRERLAEIADPESGELTIGGASAFNLVYMPLTVGKFSSRYPRVNINLIDGNMPELVQRTLDGDLDMFVSSPIGRKEGIRFEKISSTRIYLCVPPEDPINERLKDFRIPPADIDSDEDHREVDLKEFQEIPFIKLDSDRHLGRLMELLISKAKMQKKIRITADQSITSYMMTSRGVGASLMSGIDIRNIDMAEKPCFYMISNRYCKRDMYIATRRSNKLSPLAKEFINMLKESLEHLR
ncbi:MAG: LysR family transcriptional regulator [Anaerovoracaceae bacterium]|jgi:DNA-binding transcriptional LysR family regulator